MTEAAQAPRGWSLSSTCKGVTADGELHGGKTAVAVVGTEVLARVLASQARGKFAVENPAGKTLLEALAAARALEQLHQLGDSLLEAADWNAWLAGIEPPAPAPNDFPAFSLDDEIDLEPEKAFIDLTMQVTTVLGKKMLLQCRLQKWYQPDLGEVLYKEACRLEKRFQHRAMMVVILLWPSADGPGVVGRYRGTDARGRKIDFRYEVRRAWELPPEQALNSPATMMLLPLSQGAKPRLPELIGLMKARLAELKLEAKQLQTVWLAFYWSLGMVCTLEESRALLGDLLPMIQATTDYQGIYWRACREAYSKASQEAPIQAVRELIGRQARRRFGEDAAGLAALDQESSLEVLKEIAGRVPTAGGWSELLGSAASAD